MGKNTFITVMTLLLFCFAKAQNIRNIGDLKIHTNGQIGFFSSLKNDGTFTNTAGLAGFYGVFQNNIYGINSPQFYDFEINNDNGISLQIPITVNHNTNFIFGDIITSKAINNISLDLYSTSFYNGETNFSKVNGYVSITDVQNFLFPIGDENYLRPLGIDSNSAETFFKAVYMYENSLLYYPADLNFNNELSQISKEEYWVLEGADTTQITIGWNDRSAIHTLTDDLNYLVIVGFDKELREWVQLGTAERTGTLEEGFISSIEFSPNLYSAITFGTLKNKSPISHKGYHYLVTPNGDGINDFLYIPELEDFKTNRLMVFDRNGLKVFEQENYVNEFEGTASFDIPAISRAKGLPEGIYYYLITAGKDNITIQGFLYLDR